MPATKSPQDHKTKKKHGSSWKKQGVLTDLELPSGETCLARRPGIKGLIKAGVLHSMDSLTGLVETEVIPKAEGKPNVDIAALVKDQDRLEAMMTMVDKIVCVVVAEPVVLPVMVQEVDEDDNPVFDDAAEPVMREIRDDERDPKAIYVDYIEIEDKMFIMNFAVGGTIDLARFRQETKDVMGGAPAS